VVALVETLGRKRRRSLGARDSVEKLEPSAVVTGRQHDGDADGLVCLRALRRRSLARPNSIDRRGADHGRVGTAMDGAP
jgi:hypothetical protein